MWQQPLTNGENECILQYMKKYTTNTAEVRPLPFHTFYGEKWEARNAAGKVTWHTNLTDALMHAEGVNELDHLSPAARQYWNQVAMA